MNDSEKGIESRGQKVPVRLQSSRYQKVELKFEKGGGQRARYLNMRWWGSAIVMTIQIGNLPGMKNKNIRDSKRSSGERIARLILKSQLKVYRD